jgi:hypothetical protein
MSAGKTDDVKTAWKSYKDQHLKEVDASILRTLLQRLFKLLEPPPNNILPGFVFREFRSLHHIGKG